MGAVGLKRFVGGPDATGIGGRSPFGDREPRPPGESCEMCSTAIPDEHQHIVNLETRGLLCACRPCYLLFTHDGSGRANYRAVPDRYRSDPGFELSDAQWDELQVPVAMAFFFHNSVLGRVVAHYPSPAGATESLLDLAAWDDIVAHTPLAAELSPDVEALIVRRSREGNESFLVPIDACYELVGRVRMRWSGFDGGPEARQDIDDFFVRVRARSRPLRRSTGAGDG